jgi:phage terminase large subunit GpA-like protein
MFELIGGFIDGLKPEPRLTVSEWADRFRMLDSKAAAEPGPYRTDRTPYVREIQDNLSVSSVAQKIVVMKGAQVGLTEVGNNWVGYIVDNAPGPALLVQPTDEMVKRNSKMRIAPMIEATPRLRDKIKSARSKDSGNTLTQKEFPGGVLVMTGANSAVGLRSMPARFIFLDEVDGYPMDVDGEGSPIALAEKRASTFANKKIFEISTPTIEGQSVIEKDFLETDQRYFHVPCPFCGVLQVLKFPQLKWEAGKYDTVHYECEHCNEKIQERFKTVMLPAGKWIAAAPDNVNPKKIGYHVSALYSPFGWKSWAEIAEEWEKSQGDDPKLKTFYNTVLGETFKEKSDAPQWELLYERGEDYKMNLAFKEVVFITAGADVQADRIEVEIIGWMPGKRSQQIDFRVLMGDTTKSDVWQQLADILSEQWEREDGSLLGLRLMAVDSGYNTQKVYDFAKKYGFTRVVPVKGNEKLDMIFSPPRSVDTTKHGKKVGKIKVWHVGVSHVKSEVYGFLRLSKDPETGLIPNGYCHLPKREPHYFRSLTAEVLQVQRNNRGYIVYVWVKKYERNEALDCRVYGRAAASIIGMDRWTAEQWAAQNAKVIPATKAKDETATKAKPVQRVKKKSDYWKR